MATTIQRLHDDFLSCIICTDLYRDPCTLACGHTFCRVCLAEFTKTQQDAIRAKCLLCPNCKQMTRVPDPARKIEDWVKQIKPSFLIQGLLDDFASRETVDADAITNPCSTCLQHGETTPASSYCADCDINLCKKCLQTHNAIPTAASHDLSDFGDKIQVRKKRKVICKAHNNVVEFCCKDCRKAICQKCCILDHRKCVKVVTIESMMPEMTSRLKKNRDILSQRLEKTESNMKEMETRVTEIEEEKLNAQVQIKKASQTAIDFIVQKEKKLLHELEGTTRKKVGDLKTQLRSEKIDTQMYQQHREFIDEALTAESEMDMYDMYQMDPPGALLTYLPDMDEIVFLQQHILDRNLQLGSLRAMKTGFDPKCKPTLVDTIDIRIKGETKAPTPLDVTVLVANGTETVIVLDYDNCCLKSFYSRNKQSHHSLLQMRNKPCSVTRLTLDQVAVSYSEHKQITLVKVTPELVLLSNIVTEKKYRCLTALNATSVVACCDDPPSLDIIDTTGHVQRSITTDKRLIQMPDVLSLTIGGNILMSNFMSHSVLCVTPEGDVVFNYAPSVNRTLQVPRGITTSKRGDILVVDCKNNKVIQLTSNGDFVRDFLTSQNGLSRPYGICLYHDRLYVSQDKPHLLVFRVN